MSSWQSAFIETSTGLRLHYTRTGGAKPPLVLAHGISDDGLCWAPVAEVLQSSHDVIMADARGHGRSDGPPGDYGAAAMAGDLAELIGKLGLNKPAVLGHSMGAVTALALAAHHPRLPGRILLEDPPAIWLSLPPLPPADDAAPRSNPIRDWIVGVKRKTREELIAGERANNPGWKESELGPWADSKLRMSFNALSLLNAAGSDWADLSKLLPAISCPTLLITGDPARGAIVSAEGAAALQVIVPQTQVAHIPNAGHSIRRDQFAAYLAAIQPFLAA
jgi:N-formylmaleamate deformylase